MQIDGQTIEFSLLILGVASSFIAWCIKLYRSRIKPFFNKLDQIHKATRELIPNCGSSISDKINLINQNTQLLLRSYTFLSERGKQITDTLPYGYFETDKQGRVKFVNNTLCEIIEINHEDILEDGWFFAIHASDHSRVVEEWKVTIADQSPFHATFKIKDKSTVDCKVKPVYALNGEHMGFCGYIEPVIDNTALNSL